MRRLGRIVDEVVVTPSGKKTPGLDRFFSSLYGKAVPGLCFLSISLISVKRRVSYPVLMEPVAKEAIVGSPKAMKRAAKGERGRPKGSRNRNRREIELSLYLRFVPVGERTVLRVSDFVFDGAFGHHDAFQMVRQTRLQFISKLRYDAALYFPYEGAYKGRGRRQKYGSKLDYLDYRCISERYRKSLSVEKGIRRRFTRCRCGTNASLIYSIAWSS